jgi:hypothetical protein
MPELGPYGSVRGALSNERPYRDSGAPFKSSAYRRSPFEQQKLKRFFKRFSLGE